MQNVKSHFNIIVIGDINKLLARTLQAKVEVKFGVKPEYFIKSIRKGIETRA